ncbi:hypothetical protein [Sphaerospermopsis aphanizomenoides]|nr:hypothetical protein [Sphaerospermopsis aphanizomenoides]
MRSKTHERSLKLILFFSTVMQVKVKPSLDYTPFITLARKII